MKLRRTKIGANFLGPPCTYTLYVTVNVLLNFFDSMSSVCFRYIWHTHTHTVAWVQQPTSKLQYTQVTENTAGSVTG